MNILKVAVILIITLIALPIFSFYFEDPLNTLQLDVLFNVGLIMLIVSFLCFVIGELTNNNSQVDKIWSIIPIVYAWTMAYQGGMTDRLILMAVLVSIWGARLTYNFSRRGGYSIRFWEGDEDYRWEVLRQNPMMKGRVKWMLFNLFFICLYQNTLILLFTLPMIPVMLYDAPLFWADYLIAGIYLSLIIIETVADQQQWVFQKEKYRRINAGEKLDGKYEKGFVAEGLWRYMRHPNYACEQSIWITFYFFTVAASGEWLNWSIGGCLLLLTLFQGSSDFSEGISADKYPKYKEYQKKVSRFVPVPWKKWG